MNIRPAKPEDADALAKLHIDSWKAAYKGLVPQSYLNALDYEKRAQRFRDSLEKEQLETYVAENAENILGFVILGACRDEDVDKKTTGEIWGIYLSPECWRKGIGSKLCFYAEGILKSYMYKTMVLWVFAKNFQARRFYEAMGYQLDGASKMLQPGKALEAIRYRKEILK